MRHYFRDEYGCSFHAGNELRPCTCREYWKEEDEVTNKAMYEDHDRVACACNGGSCKASAAEKRGYRNSREQQLLNALFSQRKAILNAIELQDIFLEHVGSLAKSDPKTACEILRTA